MSKIYFGDKILIILYLLYFSYFSLDYINYICLLFDLSDICFIITYSGIALSELYRQSRDAMLVTSDLALRTQLTEFLDHQLVKWRRDSDHLYIPIDSTVLKQFQKSVEENEL